MLVFRHGLNACEASLLFLSNRFSSSNVNASERNEDLCKTCIVSVNAVTSERATVDLFLSNGKHFKHKGGQELPKEAIEGLKNVLVSLKASPKQIQNEADELSKKLDQRSFPASPEVIKEVRRNIRSKILSKNEGLANDEEFYDDKIREAKQENLNREVRKELRRTRFNWQPVVFDSVEGAATYILARLAKHYSEIYHVLNNFKVNDFVPESVLDYGSGTASAVWACHSKWGNKVKEYQLVEPNDYVSHVAMDVLKGGGSEQKQVLLHPNIVFRRHLIPSANKQFDLVIAHRVLIEYASRDSRIDILNSLWARTNRYLVIIESSSKEAFQALMECRDYLLTSGWEIHVDEFKAKLDQLNLYNQEIDSVLNNNNLSQYERYNLLREMIPSDVDISTKLDTGSIFAPCPHSQGCPMISAGKVCKFDVRSREVRIDGKKSRNSDGTDLSSLSYFIYEKGSSDNQGHVRVIKAAKSSKQVDFTVCTPFLGLQRFTLTKKMGDIYKVLKPRGPDESLNLKMRVLDSESKYNLFNEAIEELRKEGNIH